MVPLHKLEKLPRSQRLRKIGKLFTEAEIRLCAGNFAASSGGENPLSAAELAYLADTLQFLTRDDSFSPAVRQALSASFNGLQTVGCTTTPKETASLHRCINTVRHILRTETGQQTADWDFIGPGGKLDPQMRQSFPGMQVYLEDIRSPYNVGAMFRTAESFGVERVFLSPLCADPTHPRAERTAMGCTDILPWERLAADLPQAPIFALETGGTDIAKFPFPQRALMIVGSEELGVSPKTLELADASLGRLSIPTYGAKGSINASVAFGIALQVWATVLNTQSHAP